MQIFWLLALGFAIFVATFAVQNAGAITVRFLAWQWETSTAVVVLGSAAAGALVAGLLGTVRQVSLSLRLRTLQNRYNKLKKRLQEVTEKQGAGEVKEQDALPEESETRPASSMNSPTGGDSASAGE